MRAEPEQARSRERRQRILEAGVNVFARKGFRDTLVDDIAAEAETSKGGVYFHFPNKQAIFLALLEQMGSLLLRRLEEAMARAEGPQAKGDAALLTALRTFSSHRALSRLFFVEALGAGRPFAEAMMEQHSRFIALIRRNLDDAVAAGVIPLLDTDVAATAWFGALYEVTTRWLLTGRPARLEDAYPALRVLLARSVGLEDHEQTT